MMKTNCEIFYNLYCNYKGFLDNNMINKIVGSWIVEVSVC